MWVSQRTRADTRSWIEFQDACPPWALTLVTRENATQSTACADQVSGQFSDCFAPSTDIAAALAPGDFGTSRRQLSQNLQRLPAFLEEGLATGVGDRLWPFRRYAMRKF
jgi:hypothetical protein